MKEGILIGLIAILVIDIIAFIICFTGKIGPFEETKSESNNPCIVQEKREI